MVKETMQAVSDAEKAARETVLRAKQEGEQMVVSAREQAKKLIADAEKEGKKKADVLCGVARADGEKLTARLLSETEQERDALRVAAKAAYPAAAEKITKIVLGTPERR